MPSARALFLDRDGTIIVDKHYLADPDGVELIPGAADALRRARALGFRLFVHTNQSGIARGLHSLDDVHRCNERMEVLLGLPRPIFDGVCIAPEGPEDPIVYRKPSPRFVRETIAQFHLNPAACWMVGDREADAATGKNAGIRSVAVCTGKLDVAGWAALGLVDVPVFPSLVEFVSALEAGTLSPHA